MTYLFNTDNDELRSGSREARSKKDRYFHIMNLGWFVYTREADKVENNQGLKTRDGIVGPFDNRQQAISYIQKNMTQFKNEQTPTPDPESWRYD